MHKSPSWIDIDRALGCPPIDPASGVELGRSREGRAMYGHVVKPEGSAAEALNVSLIAGCHADEPVGPAMLDRLATYLVTLRDDEPGHPLVRRFRWRLVPHVNPDGEARNGAWTLQLGDPARWGDEGHRVVDLPAYLRNVVRELPGDDVEFGFPRDDEDSDARPENRAVAEFLRAGARDHGPYALHASFHGMAFAAGPWFLIDRAWIPDTRRMRDELRALEGDWTFHDIDRGGDKGFERIDRGFTTRPDSVAMREHFLAQGDEAMASLFRPSSMEFVRGLSDEKGAPQTPGPLGPLTLVSEMPLFLVPPEQFRGEGVDPIRPAAVRELRALASRFDSTEGALRDTARRLGIRPMPLDAQMRWQLRFLDAALRCVARRADRGADVPRLATT